MKTATWEATPGALATLINTGQFVYAQLYTIVLAGGAGTLRFTDGDLDITDGTHSWTSRGIRVDQEKSKTLAHWKRGLDVDTWTMVVLPRVIDDITGEEFPDKINATPWVAAALGGALDGADIQVDRAYFAAWPQPYQLVNTPVGILTIFAGRPAEVDCQDSLVSVMINDYRELLSIKMPRSVFSGQCRFNLYDSACGLAAATFKKTGVVIGGATQKQITSAAIVPGGSGTFTLGRLTMTSGLNIGFSRTIREWVSTAPGVFSLLNPFPFEVVAGDTFDVYPGCDKKQDACTAFGNILNYGGEPFIPAPETAI